MNQRIGSAELLVLLAARSSADRQQTGSTVQNHTLREMDSDKRLRLVRAVMRTGGQDSERYNDCMTGGSAAATAGVGRGG
jgi:hypothetical protein